MAFDNPFPKGVYLDNNATMPLLPSVRSALAEALVDDVANPSSIHQPGQKAKALVFECKRELSEWLGTRESEEWVFVSGATEAINAVLNSFQGKAIACSSVDHSAVVESLSAPPLFEIQVDSTGQPTMQSLQELENFIRAQEVTLLNWQLVNNETGMSFDLNVLQSLIEKFNVKFNHADKLSAHDKPAPQKLFVLIDGAQALGKCDESFLRRAMHLADYFVFSGHKIGAPMGVGALWMRSNVPFKPLILGGSQEKRRRAGTHNMWGILGLKAAIQDWKVNSEKYRVHMKSLKDRVISKLNQVEGFVLHGKQTETSLCNTLNFHFEGCVDESLVLALDLEKFFVSSGSACNSGSLKPSRVLKKMGYADEAALSSLRLCTSPLNTPEEIDLFCERLLHRVHHIRASRSKCNALLPAMETESS